MVAKRTNVPEKRREAEADYHLRWVACIELEANGHFYSVDEQALATIPARGAGVYMFCRRRGRTLSPQYIGRSRCFRRRIRDHLERVSMVRALAEGETGRRVVLVALVEPRRGQRAARVAAEVESLLIRHFRCAFDLVNEKGNRAPRRYVHWHGGRAYRDLIKADPALRRSSNVPKNIVVTLGPKGRGSRVFWYLVFTTQTHKSLDSRGLTAARMTSKKTAAGPYP